MPAEVARTSNTSTISHADTVSSMTQLHLADEKTQRFLSESSRQQVLRSIIAQSCRKHGKTTTGSAPSSCSGQGRREDAAEGARDPQAGGIAFLTFSLCPELRVQASVIEHPLKWLRLACQKFAFWHFFSRASPVSNTNSAPRLRCIGRSSPRDATKARASASQEGMCCNSSPGAAKIPKPASSSCMELKAPGIRVCHVRIYIYIHIYIQTYTRTTYTNRYMYACKFIIITYIYISCRSEVAMSLW